MDNFLERIDKYTAHKEFKMIFKDWDSRKAKEQVEHKDKKCERRWSLLKYCMNQIEVLER